jgi:hypothetical protein
VLVISIAGGGLLPWWCCLAWWCLLGFPCFLGAHRHGHVLGAVLAGIDPSVQPALVAVHVGDVALVVSVSVLQLVVVLEKDSVAWLLLVLFTHRLLVWVKIEGFQRTGTARPSQRDSSRLGSGRDWLALAQTNAPESQRGLCVFGGSILQGSLGSFGLVLSG